jgi:hypothetical protein
MSTKTRKAALFLIVIVAILAVSGCGEDRSNLLPKSTATQIESDLDLVRSLFREGECFKALATAEGVRNEVEALGGDVDNVLRRNLLDGVTQLQINVQDDCVQVEADPTEAVVPEPLPEEPANPSSGPEEDAAGTTGATGDTGGTGNNGSRPEPGPEPKPIPDPKPPVDNGSGGVGPSAGG